MEQGPRAIAQLREMLHEWEGELGDVQYAADEFLDDEDLDDEDEDEDQDEEDVGHEG